MPDLNLTPSQHEEAARRAVMTAERLCLDENPWFVVPLFYAAMHHIMRDLKQRSDVPANHRNPGQHASKWANEKRVTWGMNDVVLQHYDRDISRAYSQLLNASHTVRYATPLPWKQARRIREHWDQIKFGLPG